MRHKLLHLPGIRAETETHIEIYENFKILDEGFNNLFSKEGIKLFIIFYDKIISEIEFSIQNFGLNCESSGDISVRRDIDFILKKLNARDNYQLFLKVSELDNKLKDLISKNEIKADLSEDGWWYKQLPISLLL